MKYIGEKLKDKDYKKRKASYGLIFNEKGEIAVVYIEKYDMYNLIGGKIEEQETSKEALIRETKEEIGYSLKDIEYVDNLSCYYYFDIMDIYELGIMDFYKAKLDRKICNPIEEDHELVWVKPEEIVDKMYFEYHRYILSKYINRKSYIKIEERDKVTRGESTQHSIDNYLTKDKVSNVSVAVTHLNGKMSKTKNIESNRIYYFISANATFNIEDELIKVRNGDVLYIIKNTFYSVEGMFDAVLINTPAFDIENEKTE